MPEPEQTAADHSVVHQAIRVGAICAGVAVGFVALTAVSSNFFTVGLFFGSAGLLAAGSAVCGVLIALTMSADDLENEAVTPAALADEMREGTVFKAAA